MTDDEARARSIVIERLTAAQAHLGRAIADMARGSTPHDRIAAMQSAVGEAYYWLGRAAEIRQQADEAASVEWVARGDEELREL